MIKKIVLLTGSELRHDFFRIFLGNIPNIKVLKSYCESADLNLMSIIADDIDNSLRKRHLYQREQTEKDFFELFCKHTKDNSNPVFIKKGQINSEIYVNEIKKLNPDIIISYGCSIIKEPLIECFNNRFINIHLGLSPYYKGSGTNFWPFVNNELEYLGVTFMYIDKGIDTGKIFHQIKADIKLNDDMHKIGNRLIKDFVTLLPVIIENFDAIEDVSEISIAKENEKLYKNIDFTEKSLELAYNNFSKGMIDNYLRYKTELDGKVKIVYNPILKNN